MTEIQKLANRAVLLLGDVMKDRYPGASYGAAVDDSGSRVVVTAGGWTLSELDSADVGRSDHELLEKFREAAEARLGPGYPPPFKGPQMR